MTISTLRKLGGTALMLGSLLLTAYSACFYFILPITDVRRDMTLAVLNPNWIWIAALALFGVILMIFGFTAVYSKLHEGSGASGLLGYIFVVVAYLIQASKVTWEIFIYPILAADSNTIFLLRDAVIKNNELVKYFRLSASLTILVGIILFCLALVRSKEFPKAAGVLVFAGAVLYGMGPMLSVYMAIGGIAVFSIGCFVLGLNLMKSQAV
jgi:1,4-dihydroxy-2-naphthoate octaprenyltransferase